VKENKDKPLFKMLTISGLAVYIDTLDLEKHLSQREDEDEESFLSRA
jgi:hypothetical protein